MQNSDAKKAKTKTAVFVWLDAAQIPSLVQLVNLTNILSYKYNASKEPTVLLSLFTADPDHAFRAHNAHSIYAFGSPRSVVQLYIISALSLFSSI